jgi:hypothetical protein
MTMPWFLAALAAALLVLPVRAQAQAALDPRADLEAMQSALEGAVAKVSRNGASFLVGGVDSCRGYHLSGLGAFFVLAPRALPAEGVLLVRRRVSTDVARLSHERHRLQRETRRLAQQGRAEEVELREGELQAMEEQAEALQREAEQNRQKAERELEEFVQEFQIRLAPPPAPPPAPPAASPAAGPPPPRPPGASGSRTRAPKIRAPPGR